MLLLMGRRTHAQCNAARAMSMYLGLFSSSFQVEEERKRVHESTDDS